MGGSAPYSLTKSHRTPWERLGISGPLFVIFLLMGGVTVCTLTWLINQQMHPLQTHTLNSTLPGETNSLSFPSYLPQDHTVSRREVGVTKCTPQELKSTTLCLPFNATTTVYLPWGLLGHAQNSLGLPAWTYSSFNWYITKGGYGEWSWKNLVAETGQLFQGTGCPCLAQTAYTFTHWFSTKADCTTWDHYGVSGFYVGPICRYRQG